MSKPTTDLSDDQLSEAIKNGEYEGVTRYSGRNPQSDMRNTLAWADTFLEVLEP